MLLTADSPYDTLQLTFDENRPPSANKTDQKKGKSDGTAGRSSSVNPHRSSSDQGRGSAHGRKKKLTPGAGSSSKKNISIVKEEDEDIIDELTPLPVQQIERENPLLELNEIESQNGEISLKGNLVLLNLNLSRNYLTLTSVNEFLISIQYQTRLIHINDTASISSATATSIEFSGLCRLELKDMKDISVKSSIYQSLETLLFHKNPLIRLQQIKEREAKELLEQQQSTQVSQPIIPEKPRATSSIRSISQRPTSRLKD
ncbi:unnamed protein product [Rotaria sp. Silwood1]|nr:unnamed protein product [Rotaria sp. Silwood1]